MSIADDIDYVDEFDDVDSDRHSPGAPASVDNDPPSLDRLDPSTLSDIDRPSDLITLDSFKPILEHLPGFYLDQNSYMIRRSLTEADWARLRDYTRTVGKFIVTDKNSETRISPTVFLHLARLQHPDIPLLRNLSDLVIVDADASIAYLDLLLTPSLKSLKASCIPDAQQSTFSFFLTAIEQEVPYLQTLILGPGRFLPSSLQTISQFNSLHHLELNLKHEDSKLPFAFFDNIGSLAMLETFKLDARYVSGTMTGDEPTVLPILNPFPSDNTNAMDGNRNEHGARHLKTCRTPIPSRLFNQLTTLHVIGWLPLLEDLIHRVTSTKLEDVSITFIRLSFDEFKVSLAKEKAERERKAEEDRRREEAEKAMKEQEKLWKDEMERKRIDEEKRWREELDLLKEKREGDQLLREELREEQLRVGFESSPAPPSSEAWGLPPPPSSEAWGSPPPPSSEAWGHFSESPCEPRTSQPIAEEFQFTVTSIYSGGKKKKKMPVELRNALLKEQERLASLSFDAHTASFTEILRNLCCQSLSLKSLSVCQLGGFQCLSKPPTLPEEVFRTMLFLPAIESLKVKGWILDFVEGVFSAAEPIPNLKCLLLPLGENSGISLPTLRHVAKTCPKLETFQCYVDSLSPVPEYSIPNNVGLSHGLRTLSVGSSFPLPVAKKLDYFIARHLYLLFPKLETINTPAEDDAELWVLVDEFVKIFRMDDLNRQ